MKTKMVIAGAALCIGLLAGCGKSQKEIEAEQNAAALKQMGITAQILSSAQNTANQQAQQEWERRKQFREDIRASVPQGPRPGSTEWMRQNDDVRPR